MGKVTPRPPGLFHFQSIDSMPESLSGQLFTQINFGGSHLCFALYNELKKGTTLKTQSAPPLSKGDIFLTLKERGKNKRATLFVYPRPPSRLAGRVLDTRQSVLGFIRN